MKTETQYDRLKQRWRRAGYAYSAPQWDAPIDVVELLIDSVKLARTEPDLFEAGATWLARFGDVVPWRYLLWTARQRCSHKELAILGCMLETSDRFAGRARYREACNTLHPTVRIERPFPLYEGSERMPEYVETLRRHADAVSTRWGVLVGDVTARYDALEDEAVVLARNPEWFESVTSHGDVEKSALRFIRSEPQGLSKSELARRCGVTRSSVHAPVARLIRQRKIEQTGSRKTSRLRMHPTQPRRSAFQGLGAVVQPQAEPR